MKINFTQKHIHLSDEQKAYIEGKLENLKKYRKVEDESTAIRVDVEYLESKSSDSNIFLTVNMVLPHTTVRAEVDGQKVEEAIDLAYEKLEKQLEKLKG